MTENNEDIKNENSGDNKEGENKEESAQHGVMDNIAGKIEESAEQIDTDFPLSGGDEPALHSHTEGDEEEGADAAHPENKEKPKHHTWVGDIIEEIEEKISHLNTDFPLSGGDEPGLHTHIDTKKEPEE